MCLLSPALGWLQPRRPAWGWAAPGPAGAVSYDYIQKTSDQQIAGFAEVKHAALDAGAMGASISGAGPSVFAWCESRAEAERAAAGMAAAFAQAGFGSDVHITPIAGPAAAVIA